MTYEMNRRVLIGTAAATIVSGLGAGAAAAETNAAAGGSRDFDFFMGTWTVQHRKLKARMVGSRDWETFSGETTCRPLMGGRANTNDSITRQGGRVSRGVGIRSFNAADGTWADWYLSEADPLRIDSPGIGRFEGNIGIFLSDDTFAGRPIKVRGIFTAIRPGLAQWEQAFSADGRTWETNWIMRYTRTRTDFFR
jgi:hypothetical protein